MKPTRAQLILKATELAEKEGGNFKLTGKRHVRDSIVVYFAAVGTNKNKVCIEVTLDAETGDPIRMSFIPDASVLHDYPHERKPKKANPN